MASDSGLRVLLLGSGGREHAIAWSLSKSPLVSQIQVCPGNGGTSNGHLPKVSNLTTISISDYLALTSHCLTHKIDLVVLGSDAQCVDGAASIFRRSGIRVFGPSKAAAQMEGNKALSKDFMGRHVIPTAAYKRFTDYEAACRYVETAPYKVVVKASGLAAGKGVIIPETVEEAKIALEQMMVAKKFGDAGDEVVIEEFLEGDELSIISFCDGHTIKSLPPAQDHKRASDGDKGLNTGGMGCYAPTTIAPESTIRQIHREVLQPTIDGMSKDGCPFVGILFTGIMMTAEGPMVLEYNVRFGDPEAQTLLPLLETDLAEIMMACVRGRLRWINLKIRPAFSATVVVAAGGYPDSYAKGSPIKIDAVEAGTEIFHAGTARKGDSQELVTSGGRVLAVNSTGSTLREAVDRAYKGVESIEFENMFYRKDIAHRAFRKMQVGAPKTITYESAGVSVDKGNALVEQIKEVVRQTQRPGTEAKIGAFGGEFDLAAAGYTWPPILIAGIDGVGTKLKIASATNRHFQAGIDLVAMNVNDLIVQGAEPLFFLDYFSSSKLDTEIVTKFVSGVAQGCKDAGCALIGGETAEMPGMYTGDEYDVAGVAVGAVFKDHLLPRKSDMAVGDVLIGLVSSGIHSNGFSLVRKIIEQQGLEYKNPAPWFSSISVGRALMTPTRIYAKMLKSSIEANLLKGMAHITGGGLVDNIPRMLPDHLAASLDAKTWPLPPVMRWLKKTGPMTDHELSRTFNRGLGMVLVVASESVEAVQALLKKENETTYLVGKLVENKGESQCLIEYNPDPYW
ncbi:MAG: hypothetical protein M1814_006403 [Vezdaea aestivalis]|nr:MAG: hypothetical protein M1814_006403 [Vezdaea aestivalis]